MLLYKWKNISKYSFHVFNSVYQSNIFRFGVWMFFISKISFFCLNFSYFLGSHQIISNIFRLSLCFVIWKTLFDSIQSVVEMAQSSVENQFKITIGKVPILKFDFTYSFRPIYILSRIFGQMSFSIIYYPNGEIQRPEVSKFDAVWFVISLGLNFYAAYCIFVLFKTQEDSNFLPKISLFSVISIFILLLLLNLLACVSDICNRFKFMDILKKITLFDKKVKSNFNF